MKYQVIGPSWLDTDRLAITAKVPQGASREDVFIMWQNLLVNRLELKFHHESREVSVYELTVAKSGSKLTPVVPTGTSDVKSNHGSASSSMPVAANSAACARLPDGRIAPSMRMLLGRYQICAHDMTIESLVGVLAGYVDRPIFDKTGLTAKYDFELEFSPGYLARATTSVVDGTAGDQASGPTEERYPPVEVALQTQLGLKLEGRKAPADMLIIDSLDKLPAEK